MKLLQIFITFLFLSLSTDSYAQWAVFDIKGFIQDQKENIQNAAERKKNEIRFLKEMSLLEVISFASKATKGALERFEKERERIEKYKRIRQNLKGMSFWESFRTFHGAAQSLELNPEGYLDPEFQSIFGEAAGWLQYANGHTAEEAEGFFQYLYPTTGMYYDETSLDLAQFAKAQEEEHTRNEVMEMEHIKKGLQQAGLLEKRADFYCAESEKLYELIQKEGDRAIGATDPESIEIMAIANQYLDQCIQARTEASRIREAAKPGEIMQAREKQWLSRALHTDLLTSLNPLLDAK